MELLAEEQRMIRHYLLGDLDEEEYQQLEERLLTSPAFKTQVLMIEDELAEDYASGRLSASEQAAFRQRLLLTREQSQRFELLSALSAYAAQQPPVPIAVVARDVRPPHPEGLKLLAFWFRRPVT